MSDQPVATPGIPATPTVTLNPNPDKMSPAKAKAEARELRGADGWTVAELKRRYGSRWSTDWLEGIPAPVSSLTAKQQTKKDALASKPKEAPVTEQPTNGKTVRKHNVEAMEKAGFPKEVAEAAEDEREGAPQVAPAESTEAKAERHKAKAVRDADAAAERKTEQALTGKPKPSGAAGGRQDASKPKPAPRQVSKAAAARQSVARAKAAKDAAENKRMQDTLEAAAKGAGKARTTKATAEAKATTAKTSTSKPASSTGTGVSGRTLGYKKPLSDDAVRLIRSMYGKAKRAEIIAAVEQAHGVTPNVQTIDKIGKRVSRKNVPDVAPKAAKKAS